MTRPLLLATAAAVVLAGCAGGSPATTTPAYPADPDAITAVGAENIYADVIHQVGGRRVRVYTFISNANADPHEYESNPADARAVADARLVVVNGLGYDSFVDKLLKASPSSKRTVIDVQRVAGASDGDNPHLWYRPTVIPAVAAAIARELTKADPAHAAGYSSGLAAFNAGIEPLAARIAELKGKLAGRRVAFTEPVYAYMADALGLDVRSPEAFMKAVEEGNDPPTAAVAQMQDLISGRQVDLLIYNSQTETRATTQLKAMAENAGVPVVGVTETEPAGTDFQRWQLDELNAVAAALGA